MRHMRTLSQIAVMLLLSTTVLADDPLENAPGEPAEEEALLNLDGADETATLSDEELSAHRAREDIGVTRITINDQDQDGDVTDNVAVGNTNGDNLINGEAFSNSSGFLSTVQNTGNNVLIQNSTIINVSVDTSTTN